MKWSASKFHWSPWSDHSKLQIDHSKNHSVIWKDLNSDQFIGYCDRFEIDWWKFHHYETRTVQVRPGPVVRNSLFKLFMVHVLFWNFWYSVALNDDYFIGRRKCWWINLVIPIPRFYWVGQLFFGEFLNHWDSNIIDIRFRYILFDSLSWARVTFNVEIEW